MTKRHTKRLVSDRGAAMLEYALLACVVALTAISAFKPGSVINEGIGQDYVFREILLKLPIF